MRIENPRHPRFRILLSIQCSIQPMGAFGPAISIQPMGAFGLAISCEKTVRSCLL